MSAPTLLRPTPLPTAMQGSPATQPSLPLPRGPLSAALISYLAGGPPPDLHDAASAASLCDALADDDLQLALWCCYELHYDGFDGVDDRLEWDPAVLGFRRILEDRFEQALRDEHRPESWPNDAVVALRVVAESAGPPLSGYVQTQGTRGQLREMLVHRSAYQLKEADPHTWAIPRLRGPGRDALLEIQADEYGLGPSLRAHCDLFADAMAEADLSPALGTYIDVLPGVTLATDNLISMFGLNRRLRGALVGHLALFEMCSVVPMSRYLVAAQRIGGMPALERFYEVHVEADAQHSRVALEEMVAPMAAASPDLVPDIIFGASALARVEARFAHHVLDAWLAGRSSLR